MKRRCIYKKTRLATKLVALVLATGLVVFQMATIHSKATSKDYEYKAAHGDDNQETSLYLWHLAKDGDKKALDSYLQEKNRSTPFRLLLTYKDGDNSYYVEADWTKAKFYNRLDPSSVAGTAIKIVSTKDNPQVLVGEDSFVTRGALRSFFAERTGQYSAFNSWLDGSYIYKIYMPNETDDDIEKLGSKNEKVTLCHTYDKEKNEIGMWFYDGDGNPCGNQADNDVWNTDRYKRSHFQNNGKNEFYDKWILDESTVFTAQDEMLFICADTWGADPMLTHSVDRNIYSNMGANMFTINENADWDEDEVLWKVYVGEKIGDITAYDPNNSIPETTSSYVLDSPTFLRRNQTWTIQENGIVFVNSFLELNGALVVRGTLIVGDGGYIMGDAYGEDPLSYIKVEGGDVIVYKDGLINVRKLTCQDGGQVITKAQNAKDNILVSSAMKLNRSVFDYATSTASGNNSGAKACTRRTIKGYSGVQLSNNKVVFKKSSAKIKEGLNTEFTEGSGTEKPFYD